MVGLATTACVLLWLVASVVIGGREHRRRIQEQAAQAMAQGDHDLWATLASSAGRVRIRELTPAQNAMLEEELEAYWKGSQKHIPILEHGMRWMNTLEPGDLQVPREWGQIQVKPQTYRVVDYPPIVDYYDEDDRDWEPHDEDDPFPDRCCICGAGMTSEEFSSQGGVCLREHSQEELAAVSRRLSGEHDDIECGWSGIGRCPNCEAEVGRIA